MTDKLDPTHVALALDKYAGIEGYNDKSRYTWREGKHGWYLYDGNKGFHSSVLNTTIDHPFLHTIIKGLDAKYLKGQISEALRFEEYLARILLGNNYEKVISHHLNIWGPRPIEMSGGMFIKIFTVSIPNILEALAKVFGG